MGAERGLRGSREARATATETRHAMWPRFRLVKVYIVRGMLLRNYAFIWGDSGPRDARNRTIPLGNHFSATHQIVARIAEDLAFVWSHTRPEDYDDNAESITKADECLSFAES